MNKEQINHTLEWILEGHEHKEMLVKAYGLLIDKVIKDENLEGGCYLTSSIMHVLLSEMGIENNLCIGNLEGPANIPFSHGWIEIDGKVFDVACMNPHRVYPRLPVINDIALGMDDKSPSYTYKSVTKKFDSQGKIIKNMTFNKYMNPPKGVTYIHPYEMVIEWGKELRLTLEKKELMEKYKETKRTFK